MYPTWAAVNERYDTLNARWKFPALCTFLSESVPGPKRTEPPALKGAIGEAHSLQLDILSEALDSLEAAYAACDEIGARIQRSIDTGLRPFADCETEEEKAERDAEA